MDKKTLTLVENYSKSLVDVAIENNVVTEVRQNIVAIKEIFATSDMAKTFSNEGFVQSDKALLISLLQKESHPFVKNFLEVIKQNEREVLLEAILESSLEKLAAKTKEFPLDIEVASSLTDEQKTKLKLAVQQKFDISVESINEIIEPDLIGGFILKANNKIIDTSIKTQLQQLKMNLK